MRSITTTEEGRLLTGTWHFRVEAARPGDAAWTNLSDVAGGDWVLGINRGRETNDQPVSEFTIRFLRRADGVSLAPGISGSSLNQANAVFSPLVYPGVAIRVFAASTAKGGARPANSSTLWRKWLVGEIEDVSWPGNDVSARCLTLDAVIQRTQIKEAEEFGAPDPGEPMSTVIQGLLNRWMDNPPPLYTPVATSFNVGEGITSEGSLLDFVRSIPQRKGYDLRYKWSDVHNDFRFTLFLPPRDNDASNAVLSLGPSDILAYTDLSASRKYVRNDFTYRGTAPDGTRFERTRENPTSIGRFGRVWMGITDGDNDPPVTTAEADQVLAYAEHDLADLHSTKQIRIPFVPWLELHDVLNINPDNARYDFSGIWSVVGVSHEITDKSRVTIVDLHAGSPIGLYRSWIRKRGTEGAPVTTHSWITQGVSKQLRLAVDPPDSTIYYRILTESTVWSSAPGPSVVIPVSLRDQAQVIEYYSVSSSGIAEHLRRTQLDEDLDPEFETLSLSEPSANRILARVVGMDDDCVRWSMWARKGNSVWLRDANGVETNVPDPDFLKVDSQDPAKDSVLWHAGDGVWEVLARAYDERGRFHERISSITIPSGATANAELSNLSLALVGSHHRISWTHNAEAATGHRVVIRERIDGGSVKDVVTLTTARPPTWEPGETADTVAGSGGFDVPVSTGTTTRNFDYEVLLYDGTEFVTSYNLSISGPNYAAPGSGGAGSTPGAAPASLVMTTPTTGAVALTWQNTIEGTLIEIEYQWYDAGQWKTWTRIQTQSSPASHMTGGIPSGRLVRAWAQYVNAAGAGPWSNPSNSVTVS